MDALHRRRRLRDGGQYPTSIYRAPAAGDKAADRQVLLVLDRPRTLDAVALQEGIAASTQRWAVSKLVTSSGHLADAKELRRQEIEVIEGPVWRRRRFVHIAFKAWRALALPYLR